MQNESYICRAFRRANTYIEESNMKVVYKNWEDGQGLEEIQAKIYTEVSGLPARADEIRHRNNERGTDSTLYALTEDGKPLAYVTSYRYDDGTDRAGIGYPWSLRECPVEVKEKIFNDLMKHLHSQNDIKEIRTSVPLASQTKEDQIKFFREHSFSEVERGYRYTLDLDIGEASKMKLEGDAKTLVCKEATMDDIDALIEITKSDPQVQNAFPTDEAFREYFADRVLKDGHCVMLKKGEVVLAASAPLKLQPDGRAVVGEEERTIMRFTAVRPGHEYAWKRLVTEVAKQAKKAGWADTPLRVTYGYSASGAIAQGIADLRPEVEPYSIVYKYEKK